MTGQRRVIARVLSDADDHPDVEELYRRASAMDARISIATVYRTVRLLEEKNILERRDFGGGRARYEATEHGLHYHLIDIETGRVIEFQNAAHDKLMREIAGFAGLPHGVRCGWRCSPAGWMARHPALKSRRPGRRMPSWCRPGATQTG